MVEEMSSHIREIRWWRGGGRLAGVAAEGWVDAEFTGAGLEDEPTGTATVDILDEGPAEDVAKESAGGRGVVGIDEGVDAGDHATGRKRLGGFFDFDKGIGGSGTD